MRDEMRGREGVVLCEVRVVWVVILGLLVVLAHRVCGCTHARTHPAGARLGSRTRTPARSVASSLSGGARVLTHLTPFGSSFEGSRRACDAYLSPTSKHAFVTEPYALIIIRPDKEGWAHALRRMASEPRGSTGVVCIGFEGPSRWGAGATRCRRAPCIAGGTQCCRFEVKLKWSRPSEDMDIYPV